MVEHSIATKAAAAIRPFGAKAFSVDREGMDLSGQSWRPAILPQRACPVTPKVWPTGHVTVAAVRHALAQIKSDIQCSATSSTRDGMAGEPTRHRALKALRAWTGWA
jgi:hypothetical protein